MKKEIYELFTLENGIILSQAVLDYISKNYTDSSSLQSLLASFKSKFGNTSSISISQIESISQRGKDDSTQKRNNTFNIKTFKFLQKDFNRRFHELKQPTAVPISFLKEESALIFGLFFKNKSGTFSLEDDFGVIELEMSDVQNEIFLFEYIFVGVIGKKEFSKFKVKEFILPKVNVSSNNTFLQDVDMKICIFGSISDIVQQSIPESMVDDTDSVMKSIIKKEQPDVCIISTDRAKDDIKTIARSIISATDEIQCNVVLCSTRKSSKYLPMDENNPFILETFNNSIGFVDFNVFEERKRGVLISHDANRCPVELFLKSMFSQKTLVPFSGSDLPVEKYPNILVVSQDFQPLVAEVDGIKFMSLPAMKEGYYGVIDNGKCEIKKFK